MSNNKEALFLLSTTDNPLNPFDDWVAWYLEDLRLGHDTCGLVARLASVSDSIDDAEYLWRPLLHKHFGAGVNLDAAFILDKKTAERN